AQSPGAAEFFETKIRPVLAQHCFKCHSSELQMAGLNLSTAAGLLKGGESGPVVIPGEPENSRLVAVVSYQEKLKMPPTGKLPDEQIADIRSWVKMGASWPDSEAVATPAPASKPAGFTKEQREFWSFQPVAECVPPPVKNRGWISNPIDSFILSKLESKGLKPAPPADKWTLLRRATFDLTGLPPTEKEIADFLTDRSPGAFGRVVERLLTSPRYGEHWGRHWLDVARYADSTGLDEDHRYPYAWRYRDYVIDAFNRDLPYDRFLTEQLAGDLLPAGKAGEVNANGIVATGFLALGPKPVAQQDKMQMVYDVVDEQIDVTSKAFMGLTVACARCHDHKFDPISTKDYYSLASIFASTKSFSKIEGTVSRLFFEPLVPKEVYAHYQEYQNRIEQKKTELDELQEEEARQFATRLRPRLADYMLAARAIHRQATTVSDTAQRQGLDAAVLDKWVKYLEQDEAPRPHLDDWHKADDSSAGRIAAEYQKRFEAAAVLWEETLSKWKKKVESALKNQMPPPERPKPDAVKDRFFAEVSSAKGPFGLSEKEQERYLSPDARQRLSQLREEIEALKKAAPPEPPMACAVADGAIVKQRVFVRGNYNNVGEEVGKRFPVILTGEDKPPVSDGRSGRLELARWLTSPNHPLTARVMTNRIWQWHFGEGLVRTASNYGKLGEAPTHPELLDYLARRFVESGWSVKAMHRLIMLSSAYRMSSIGSREQVEMDPGNRLVSRFNRRRLQVEEIRDAFLSFDGSLDATIGGTLQSGSGTDGENSEKRLSFNPDESRRRTVYLPLRRSNLPSLLNLFDFGDATTTSEGRMRTNVAPQALFMMNSRFVAERSLAFAKFLLADAAAGARRIERAYVIAVGRKPDSDETSGALQYIGAFQQRLGGPESELKAWQSFCRALMASNEFIYLE
ncbi:MAG: hypothetical protein DMG10_17810, partial [Acidobacteria bacterium]